MFECKSSQTPLEPKQWVCVGHEFESPKRSRFASRSALQDRTAGRASAKIGSPTNGPYSIRFSIQFSLKEVYTSDQVWAGFFFLIWNWNGGNSKLAPYYTTIALGTCQSRIVFVHVHRGQRVEKQKGSPRPPRKRAFNSKLAPALLHLCLPAEETGSTRRAKTAQSRETREVG